MTALTRSLNLAGEIAKKKTHRTIWKYVVFLMLMK